MRQEELRERIKEYKLKRKKEQELEKQEKRKQREREKKFWEREKQNEGEKEKFCSLILQWRDDFMKKQDFRDLFDEDSEIKIFYGNWGHKLPRYNDNGCWS